MWSRIKSWLRRKCIKVDGKTAKLRISTKIACLYGAILFVMLCLMSFVTGLGIYFGFYNQAEREMDLSIRNVLQQLDAGKAFTREFWLNEPILPGVVLRVTDVSGQVFINTDNHYPTVEDVDAHVVKHKPLWASEQMEVSKLHNMVIYHEKIDTVYRGEMLQLHFYRTITADEQFLRRLQFFVLSGTVLSFILALFAGYFVSNRILRPIRTLTQTARKIEVERMDRRIPVPESHDELSELADTFNHMLDRLQAGFKQQQRFVSDASHELRTPVTVILGYSDLLSRWGRTDKSVLDEGIDSIRSEAEDMQQLIEKLLFLARADQKRQVLHKENLELSELVADVMKKMQLVEKDHTVELRENEQGEIYGDQVTIRQMMRIFLQNSSKYTPKGGHIWASSHRSTDGKFMLLELADDGIGIAKENQKKIFERFYRVDSSRTKAEGGVSGTGLGLSIAQWIAEQHDIKISIDSDLGKGTKFTLKIPLVG